MIDATELKNGVTYSERNLPYLVLKYEHQNLGRGGGTVKLLVRNLESGGQETKTYKSTVKVDEINTNKRTLQFLYSDNVNAVFMNPSSYDQVEVPVKILGDDVSFIKVGEEVNVLFWDDRPLSVEIAPKVTLAVADTTPGVKGNSAANIYKSATLENGLVVKVPLFIKTGDKIQVDTRSGDYVERVAQE